MDKVIVTILITLLALVNVIYYYTSQCNTNQISSIIDVHQDPISRSATTITINKCENLYDNVVIYVIGDTPRGLRELVKQIKADIIQYDFLREIPAKKGVVIVTRRLAPSEEEIVSQLLKKMFVIITLNEEAKKQIDHILSRVAAFSVTFNGTNVYIYKLISTTPRKGGRYPVMIKGYAGNSITYNTLNDAIKILEYETSDWRIVGFVSWSSDEQWKPYGKLNIEHEILYYTPDPWSDMDLYAVRCVTEIISGAKLDWVDVSGDAWWNDYIESHYYLNYYTSIYDLRDYSPSPMSNIPSQITVSLTWLPRVSLTWSYPGDYIMSISSEGDLGANIAGWVHDLGEPLYTHATKETVKIEPGFEFTVSPEVTGKQRWEISGEWVVPTRYYPYKPFKGTVVIEFTLHYS